ncbi:hypothetical protein QQG55_51200 [Brugia pahangi]
MFRWKKYLTWKKYWILFIVNISCILYFLHFSMHRTYQRDPFTIVSTNFSDNSFNETLLLENTCKFPIIEPNEPNLDGYIEHYRSIHCNSQMPNMASMDDGYLIVHGELEPWKQIRLPKYKCYYQGLSGGLYPNISWYQLIDDPIEIAPSKRLRIPYDQFIVRCYNKTLLGKISNKPFYNESMFYERAFVTFSKMDDMLKKKLEFKRADPEKPSLSILVLDSVSRNQFLRHMHKTVALMKQLGFIILEGYTKVGDNSAVNLLPILAGKSILPQIGGNGDEILPLNEIVSLEDIDFLWKMMKERKCLTMINDDIGSVSRGLFYYPKEKFQGYKAPPAHFYFRPFHLFNTRHNVIPASGQCLRTGEICAEVYLDIWETFATKFKDLCHFSFNFITDLTHNNPNYIEVIDERLSTSLQRLHGSGVLNSTALVIMGDHGNRIGSIQRTYIGRIEERAPLFSIRLPDAFTYKYQEETKNLMMNTKRLTSNFDIHQTLKDISRAEFRRNRFYYDRKGRGISLMDEVVNKDRTCEDAGIPQNFCLCMERRNLRRLNSTSTEFKNLTKLARNTIAKSDCFDVKHLQIISERIDVYAINQMVRQGLRDQTDWPKIRWQQAELEIIYFEINVTVPILTQNSINRRISILFRVKHYVRAGEYALVGDPYVYHDDFGCATKKLDAFCSHCI